LVEENSSMPGTDLSNNSSGIADFFKDRSIFITGATGFIGMAILEKLLRCCTSLNTIYILVRPKKDTNSQSRIKKLFENPIFESLKLQNEKSFQKIVVIKGDIGLPGLGLTTEDTLTLQESVSVVIHAAATINFNEKLKHALNLNVTGTQRLVELCKSMRNFAVLVHVSTAYANCNRSIINEVIYPMASNPSKLNEKLAKMSDEEIDEFTPKIIENRPNTYTYTKAMAEYLLNKAASELPICIIRPSIVTGIWEGPLRGWLDGAIGIAGIPALWGKGILRTLRVKGDKVVDLIPVDIVVNLILASAWDMGTSPAKHLRVYNCCSGEQNGIKWDEIRRIGNKILVDNPYSGAIWYPHLSYNLSIIQNQINNTFQHYLPAVFMNLVELLSGQRRRALRAYQGLTKLTAALQPFLKNEWNFTTNRLRELELRLSPHDRITFQLNIRNLNWTEYLTDYCAGIGRHILKEKDGSVVAARGRISKLFWIRRFFTFLPVLLILSLIVCLTVYAYNL